MLDEPQIVRTPAQRAAVIRITVPRDEVALVMGPAFAELMAAVGAQGIETAGPAFSHHFRVDPKVFDFEVGVPVSAQVTAAGRMTPGELPAATVARSVYHGSYEGLGPAWEALSEWVASHGHGVAPDFWECYVTGPESGPDPANWRTELNRPLVI